MRFIFLFCFMVCNVLWSQDKHLLYNQTHNPQSLMLNPGAAYEKTNFHIGVPGLSNLYASLGNTVLNIDKLFNTNDFNTNIAAAINRVSSDDFIAFNQKLDLVNIGWRNNKRYFSAGVYLESDGIANFPKDLLELAYYGNADEDRSYDIGQINFRANLQTVFHFGINKQVNKNLYLGVRAKLYISSFNARSVRNSGQFNSSLSDDGLLLNQSISNLNLRIESTGIEDLEEFASDKILFGTNYGLGLDFGLSYNLNNRVEFTASLLDLGFIRFSKDTRRDEIMGSYEYDGISIQFPNFNDGDNLIPYYQNLADEIEENFPAQTTAEAYTYIQPTKLNLGLSYNFGGMTSPCYCRLKTAGSLAGNQTLSLHGFAMFSAGNLFYSLNATYQRSFSEVLYAKVSLGVDQFNRPNYGAGVAVDVWKLNIFLNVDRLNNFSNIYNAEALAYQFGLNLKF